MKSLAAPRRLTTPALLLCLIFLLVAAPQTASAKDTWTSVRTPNFFLIGNASEKEIRQTATRLEQFRDVFSRLFTRARLNDDVPTTVIVFKNANSYKPFNPRASAGYFQPGEDVNYITLNAESGDGDEENPFAIIFHEYMHLLVQNNVSPNTPAWLNEGMAEFYSTLAVKGGDKEADIGRLISYHVHYLRQQKLLPLSTLLAVDHSSPHYNEKSKRGVFYAQSWALVHYLMLGKEQQRRPQITRYLNLVAGGTSPQQSFKLVFEAEAGAIEKELRDYINRNAYPFVTFKLESQLNATAETQSAVLTEAEAMAYLGDLALHTKLPEVAETHLQKALALDPKSASAHASLGMLRMRQRRFDDAKDHLRQAVAADARNHLAHYYYAYVLSREGMNEVGLVKGYPAPVAEEMRASLRKAAELKPDFAETYHLLAFVNLVTGQEIDESVKLIERARQLAPGKQELVLVLAQLHMRRQDFDAARKLVEPIAQTSPDATVRAGAQRLLNSIVSVQEQLARFKADGESSSAGAGNSGGGAPRLVYRGDPDDAVTTRQPPTKEEEEKMIAEATMSAVEEALRKPAAGETRVRGVLVRIECDAKGIIFVVKEGARVLKFRSADFQNLHIMAFTPDAMGDLGCGARDPESAVVMTYRPAKDARAKADGDAVALEFVPKSFQLKP